MNKCKGCGMIIHDSLKSCPLCGTSMACVTGERQYPLYNYETKKSNAVEKRCVHMTVIIIGMLLLVNILTYGLESSLWSLNVAAAILYAWLLVRNTILSKIAPGAKVLLQVMALSVMVVTFDATSGFLKWSVDYVIPFLIIGTTFIVTMFMLRRRMKWAAYISYAISLIFIGFVPVLLFAFGLADVWWPGATSAAYSLITLASFFIFADRKFKDELIHRFHF